jgi:hypothetical protein
MSVDNAGENLTTQKLLEEKIMELSLNTLHKKLHSKTVWLKELLLRYMERSELYLRQQNWKKLKGLSTSLRVQP